MKRHKGSDGRLTGFFRMNRYDLHVWAEMEGRLMKVPQDVRIQGTRLPYSPVQLYGLEPYERVLFEPTGHPEFTFSVPEVLVGKNGVSAQWQYYWKEAEICGVMLMLGDIPSQYVMPFPRSVLQEACDGDGSK